MNRLASITVVLAGAGMLAGLRATNPDYDRAIAPFVTTVAANESGTTQLIGGRFLDWRLADRIAFPHAGAEVTRDTGGSFLIVDLEVRGTTQSTPARAVWIGSSGRRYATTRRVSGLARQLDEIWLQPGVPLSALAIFELPPDEVEGGSLLLTLTLDQPLEGNLRLLPPPTAPTHEAIARFDG